MPPEERSHRWDVESEELRNKHLINNPLPICEKCNTPGHQEKNCRVKTKESTDKSNIASVLAEQLLPIQWQLNQQGHNSTSDNQPSWKNRYNKNNTFRSQQQQHNNSSKSTPPNQKYCFRYAQGLYCQKERCIFLHSCELCGSTIHGAQQCDKVTSTNFTPTSKP